MTPTSTLTVDLSAVRNNVRRLVRLAVESRVVPGAAFRGAMPALKADAYGMGAVAVARALAPMDEVCGFAVYSTEEASELLSATAESTKPVLVLMPAEGFRPDEPTRTALRIGRLHFTVHGPAQLARLMKAVASAGPAAPVPLHVQVDTGMSRGGCAPGEFSGLVGSIARSGLARLAGVFTHFSSADDDAAFTQLQHRRLRDAVASLGPDRPPGCVIHAANTFGTLRSADLHEDMIRPGLGLLGYGPELMTGSPLLPVGELRPALRWTSRVALVKTVPAGEGVGYNLRWRAARESVIGLVPVGYADGYPTQSADPSGAGRVVAVLIPTPAGVHRASARVVGAVNMDQITIDLTDAVASTGSAAAASIETGLEVELITPDPLAPTHAVALARASRIYAYELVTGLGRRVTRVYRGGEEQAPA